MYDTFQPIHISLNVGLFSPVLLLFQKVQLKNAILIDLKCAILSWLQNEWIQQPFPLKTMKTNGTNLQFYSQKSKKSIKRWLVKTWCVFLLYNRCFFSLQPRVSSHCTRCPPKSLESLEPTFLRSLVGTEQGFLRTALVGKGKGKWKWKGTNGFIVRKIINFSHLIHW